MAVLTNYCMIGCVLEMGAFAVLFWLARRGHQQCEDLAEGLRASMAIAPLRQGAMLAAGVLFWPALVLVVAAECFAKKERR
jgi:hypothetical protein